MDYATKDKNVKLVLLYKISFGLIRTIFIVCFGNIAKSELLYVFFIIWDVWIWVWSNECEEASEEELQNILSSLTMSSWKLWKPLILKLLDGWNTCSISFLRTTWSLFIDGEITYRHMSYWNNKQHWNITILKGNFTYQHFYSRGRNHYETKLILRHSRQIPL